MIDERDLVEQLQKGSVKAFDSLFAVYSPKLYVFALKYFKNETEAEELAQDVFVKIWEHRQYIKSEHSFKSYLFTIALNQIRKYFNKRVLYHKYFAKVLKESSFGEADVLAEDYETFLYRINCIVDQMPPRRREIFRRSKLEGKSSKEVAAEMNITPGAVDNQVSEALLFIRSKMNFKTPLFLLYVSLFWS